MRLFRRLIQKWRQKPAVPLQPKAKAKYVQAPAAEPFNMEKAIQRIKDVEKNMVVLDTMSPIKKKSLATEIIQLNGKLISQKQKPVGLDVLARIRGR